jgi:hypothetical protein
MDCFFRLYDGHRSGLKPDAETERERLLTSALKMFCQAGKRKGV